MRVMLVKDGDKLLDNCINIPCPGDGLTLDEMRGYIREHYMCQCGGSIDVDVYFADAPPEKIQIAAFTTPPGKKIPTQIVDRRSRVLDMKWMCTVSGTLKKRYDDECLMHWDWQHSNPQKRASP